MIVLHAAHVAHRSFVWGETSDASNACSEISGAVRTDGGHRSDPPLLSFGASDKALAAALKEMRPGLRVDTGTGQHFTGWLPTVRGRPLASSPLIAPPPEDAQRNELAPFRVFVLPLATPALVDLLAAAIDRTTVQPGLVVGVDWLFWGQALRFAVALATRQQFLPGVAKFDERWHAHWDAVFVGADADRLAKLARAMPHVCRAFVDASDKAGNRAVRPPATPAVAVLTAFVNEVVDHWVRSGHSDASGEAAERRNRQARSAFDSLHDHWLHALRSPDGRMEGSESELTELAAQIDVWRRPISVTAQAPVKLCFRLEEPGEPGTRNVPIASPSTKRNVPSPAPLRSQQQDGVMHSPVCAADRWYVRFLLQPVDDPSLLIDAADVWTSPSKKSALTRAASLPRNGFNAKEYLLSALGQASSICSPIEAGLQTAVPAGYELDADGAHDFLTEKALGLEQAGFGVLLPAWWSGKGSRLRLTTRAHVKSPTLQAKNGSLSLDAIVKFDWEIALGDTRLTESELKALAELKSPLVKFRGQWVHLNADEIHAATALWNKKATTGRVRDVVRMALGAMPAGGWPRIRRRDAPTAGSANCSRNWKGARRFEELPAPDGFPRRITRPYQQRGVSWLAFLRRWGLGACLADDMGLGKTVQALALMQRERECGQRHARCCSSARPRSSATGRRKPRASRRICPCWSITASPARKARRSNAKPRKHAMVLSSYALLHRDFEMFKDVRWGGVMLDEAQNIKNPETKQAQAARALTADYRIALTGTPVENNVGDLWSIMEFLNPGFLGTQGDFKTPLLRADPG